MPSIDPLTKQELTVRLLEYAHQNKNDIDENELPVPDQQLLNELSLLNGISKATLRGMLNDMLDAYWLERDAQHKCIITTSKGLIAKSKMDENIKDKKRTKELRRLK